MRTLALILFIWTMLSIPSSLIVAQLLKRSTYSKGFQDGAHYAIGEILEDLLITDSVKVSLKWRERYNLKKETL